MEERTLLSPWDLVGESSAMQELRANVERVARSDRPVIVAGETGSGKELIVRAIHARSRHPQPLLDLNCGALSETLIESQLFGHEKGAFTGADRPHEGFFSTVGLGSLFLDEIAELPFTLQAKLLRALETRTFRPLGARKSLSFRGRVIAATHVDLEARVADGRFREDLLYRLNVLEVRVPSLAERRDDIPVLIAHFSARSVEPLRFSPAAMDRLVNMAWPGNVRQLRNVIDRLDVFVTDRQVTEEVLAHHLSSRTEAYRVTQPPSVSALVQELLASSEGDKLQRLEAALLTEALRIARGNKTQAARILGCHRKFIERRLGRYQRDEWGSATRTR